MSALSISPTYDVPTAPARPELRVVEAPRRGDRRRQAAPRVAAPPRTPSGRVRLTRRGRLTLVVAFLAVVLGVMTAMGGWATASLTGGTPEPVRVVEVHPGQTLYDIAGDVAKPGHIREMVFKIQELNSLPSATISEGQRLAVPRG
jgi:hypothetical protein